MREAIIREIMQEYDEIRRTEENHLREREQKVLEAIPEIARIRQQIIELVARRSREIIQNPQQSIDDIKELQQKIADLKTQEGQLLSEKGFSPSYLQPRYRCSKCRDTGYVGDLVKERCTCFVQRLLTKTYQTANLRDLENQNFETFNPEVFDDTPEGSNQLSQRQYMNHTKNRLQAYINEFPDNPRRIVLFTGPTGLGKTFLLNCMAKAILDKCHTVIQVSAYKVFEQLFRTSLKSSSESEFLQSRLFQTDVLIVDDLGTESQLNNFTSEGLFNIINERSLNNQHTFFSTNLNLAELRDRYSERITSRIFDTSNSVIIRFWGQDVRVRPKV